VREVPSLARLAWVHPSALGAIPGTEEAVDAPTILPDARVDLRPPPPVKSPRRHCQVCADQRASPDLRHGGCLKGAPHPPFRRNLMGKYFFAWLLGVPVGVLVLIYLFMH